MFLAMQQERYKNGDQHWSFFDMGHMLVELKETAQYSYMYQTYSQSLLQNLMKLDAAYQQFFRRVKDPKIKKKGFPRFTSRRNGWQSMSYPQSVYLNKNTINIPKLGQVIIEQNRAFDGKIKTVTLKKTPTNRYFVSILLDDSKPPPELPKKIKSIVSVDLGLKTLATVTDGVENKPITNPRYYVHHAQQLRHEQKSLSRTQRGSHRYRVQRKKVARVHEKLTSARSDYLHKLTTQLVSDNQAVVVEDLNIAGMQKNRRLAKHIGDVGWGEIIRQVAYKCQGTGKHLIKVDRYFPSSKTCHSCGTINKELVLEERTWTCSMCGSDIDRDVNAAQNIRTEGIRKLTAAGVVVDNRGEDVRLPSVRAQATVKRVGLSNGARPEILCF